LGYARSGYDLYPAARRPVRARFIIKVERKVLTPRNRKAFGRVAFAGNADFQGDVRRERAGKVVPNFVPKRISTGRYGPILERSEIAKSGRKSGQTDTLQHWAAQR